MQHLSTLYENEELYLPHEVDGYRAPIFEGLNKQRVLVLYNTPELAPAEREQLMKILGALKLTIDDIALASATEVYKCGYAGWVNDGPPFDKMIGFGASALNMGLTVRLKRYFINEFNGKQLLFSDSLETLIAEPKLKGNLWTVLQVLFGLTK